MAGQVNVYTLGHVGVDLVNQPNQTDEGAVLSAQNAVCTAYDDELALRKRDGIAKFTTDAMDGPIKALFEVGAV